MHVVPSIDVLNGRVVRLYQGDYQAVTDYGTDPAATAQRFVQAGAVRLHIVDLNAARGDWRANLKVLVRIRKAVTGLLQIGGGVRTDGDVERLLGIGFDRLVIGTTFAKHTDVVGGWVAHYGNVFLAGIDADEGRVKIAGWEDDAQVTDVELARRALAVGVCGIVYTSIRRDGTFEGPDIERTNAVARESGLPVILSGGIGSVEDLRAIARSGHSGVVGAVVGRALYEGKIALDQACAEFPGDPGGAGW